MKKSLVIFILTIFLFGSVSAVHCTNIDGQNLNPSFRFTSDDGVKSFCDFDGSIKPQLASGSETVCSDNFECLSNVCAEDKCSSYLTEFREQTSIFRRISCWAQHPLSLEFRRQCLVASEIPGCGDGYCYLGKESKDSCPQDCTLIQPKKSSEIESSIFGIDLYKYHTFVGYKGARHWLNNDNVWTKSDFLYIFDKAEELGIKNVRIEFDWANTEKKDRDFDWRYSDALVNGFKEKGINVEGMLWQHYGNPYEDEFNVNCSFPRNDFYIDSYTNSDELFPGETTEDAWLRFVNESVKRYKDDINSWTIHNEEHNYPRCNNSRNGYDFTIQEFNNFVHLTSQKIKENDPESEVIIGGIKYNWADSYTEQHYFSSGLINDIDVFNIHVYNGIYPEKMSTRHQNYSGLIKYLNDLMLEYGEKKPIHVGEFGFHYNQDSITQDAQDIKSKYSARFLLLNLGLGVEKINLFRFREIKYASESYVGLELLYCTAKSYCAGSYDSSLASEKTQCVPREECTEPKFAPLYYVYQRITSIFSGAEPSDKQIKINSVDNKADELVNLIQNPGFELDDASWTLGAEASIFSGASKLLQINPLTPNSFAEQKITGDFLQGEILLLKADMKDCDHETDPWHNHQLKVYVKYSLGDDYEEKLSAGNTNGLEKFVNQLVVPKDTNEIYIKIEGLKKLNINTLEYVWADNLILSRIPSEYSNTLFYIPDGKEYYSFAFEREGEDIFAYWIGVDSRFFEFPEVNAQIEVSTILDNPIIANIDTGEIFDVPVDKYRYEGGKTILILPIKDYPIVIAEKGTI